MIKTKAGRCLPLMPPAGTKRRRFSWVELCSGLRGKRPVFRGVNTFYRCIFGGEQGPAFPPKPEYLLLLMGHHWIIYFIFLKKRLRYRLVDKNSSEMEYYFIVWFVYYFYKYPFHMNKFFFLNKKKIYNTLIFFPPKKPLSVPLSNNILI